MKARRLLVLVGGVLLFGSVRLGAEDRKGRSAPDHYVDPRLLLDKLNRLKDKRPTKRELDILSAQIHNVSVLLPPETAIDPIPVPARPTNGPIKLNTVLRVDPPIP